MKALGHDYSKDWTIDKKATCTEEGSKSHHCTRCDSKSDITSISKKNMNGIMVQLPRNQLIKKLELKHTNVKLQ